MTLLETLRAHTGGLLHIKSELFWYGERGPDGSPGRICLVLDGATVVNVAVNVAVAGYTLGEPLLPASAVPVLLLIDGAPHWIWVGQEDVELIT